MNGFDDLHGNGFTSIPGGFGGMPGGFGTGGFGMHVPRSSTCTKALWLMELGCCDHPTF